MKEVKGIKNAQTGKRIGYRKDIVICESVKGLEESDT